MTDLATDPTAVNSDIAKEALRGRWQATVCDDRWRDIDVAELAGSATSLARQGMRLDVTDLCVAVERGPGPANVAASWDGFATVEEFARCWVRAQAMAAGLNAAAEAVTR